MTLDDHGAARGERGRGVAARDAEGEREVAGAEDGHGADRHEHPPDVRPRDRDRSRVRRVDDRLHVVAALDQRRKCLQLARRALQLAAQARLGEPGLGAGHRHDLVARGAQPRGGAAEQLDAPPGLAQAWIVERLGSGLDRPVDILWRGLREGRAGLARGWIDGGERGRGHNGH